MLQAQSWSKGPRQEHAGTCQDQRGQELEGSGAEAGEMDIRTMLAARTLQGTVSEMGGMAGIRGEKPRALAYVL